MPKEAELRENEAKKVQMEWDRLQKEALAAQRYRLEQEIEQARAQGLISGGLPANETFMGVNWNSKWVLAGVAVLVVGCVVAVALLT